MEDLNEILDTVIDRNEKNLLEGKDIKSRRQYEKALRNSFFEILAGRPDRGLLDMFSSRQKLYRTKEELEENLRKSGLDVSEEEIAAIVDCATHYPYLDADRHGFELCSGSIIDKNGERRYALYTLSALPEWAKLSGNMHVLPYM